MSFKLVSSLIFLPVILFIGLVTSHEDFKNKRIRNKWLLIGLLYVLVVYLLFFAIYMYSIKINTTYVLGDITYYLIRNFDKWFVNLIASIILSYILWHFKTWGAGDAKLFITYVSLIPISQYSRGYFNYYFASFLLLFYIFVPATIFLLIKTSVNFVKQYKIRGFASKILDLLKEKFTKFHAIGFFKTLSGFFTLFLLFIVINHELHNRLASSLFNQNLIMLFSLIAFPQISRVFKKNFIFVMAAALILVTYLLAHELYYLQNFFVLIRSIILKTILFILFSYTFKKIIDLHSERAIRKTMPFAPWMFLGALLTWFL